MKSYYINDYGKHIMRVESHNRKGEPVVHEYDKRKYNENYYYSTGSKVIYCSVCCSSFKFACKKDHLNTNYHKLAEKLHNESNEEIKDIRQAILNYRENNIDIEKKKEIKARNDESKIKSRVKITIKKLLESLDIPPEKKQKRLDTFILKYPDHPSVKILVASGAVQCC